MKRVLIIAITFGLCLLSLQAHSQGVTDTTTKSSAINYQDLYKEFSLTSFADEEPVKEIDSSTLRSHLIGVKWGYSLSNVSFTQDITRKPIMTPKNFGIYYIYYHSLWERMPYFGLQTGIEFNEIGYRHILEGNEELGTFDQEFEYRYQAIEVPLLSQFRVDMMPIRLLINIGPYGYYIFSTDIEGGIPETTNKFGIGIMGGVGFAVAFKPFEIHVEGNYKFTMSHFYTPDIYSDTYWVYTHSNQIVISVGLFVNLGSKKR